MENLKKKKLDIVIEVILAIAVVVLLLHNCALVNKKGNSKEENGNVDIIEIKCDDKKCEIKCVGDDCDKKEDDNNTNNQSKPNGTGTANRQGNSGNSSSGNNDETEDEDEYEDMVVYDKDNTPTTWNGATDLKIFSKSIYNYDGKIAPESENTYKFIVKNSSVYKLKYNIDFVETNDYNINMKYKLRKGDEYIIDHYVSASELNQSNITIEVSGEDVYYLEWKWISSSNDTSIGTNPEASYGLQIEVNAESIN